MKSRTASVFRIRAAAIMLGLLALVIVSSCLPKPLSESSGGVNITLYGFSIMKEPLEKAIYPAFIAKVETRAQYRHSLHLIVRRFGNNH